MLDFSFIQTTQPDIGLSQTFPVFAAVIIGGASLTGGKPGVLHGMNSYFLQNDDGQIQEAHSISAGLDYPGIGPLHAHLIASGRAEAISITDEEALASAFFLSRKEGIIPALETAHAFAALDKMEYGPEDVIVICLSGRGDKDLDTYIQHLDRF